MKKPILFFVSLVIFPLTLSAGNSTGVIYGVDDRLDMFELTDSKLYDLARATVIIAGAKVVANKSAGRFRLITTKMEGYCSDERFLDQERAGFCSGFLIAPDIVMTAGHCIVDKKECKRANFLFDFGIYKKGDGYYETSGDKLYACKELIFTQNSKPNGPDLAIIRLDRKVTDRVPVLLENQSSIHENDLVFMLGYPKGLPLKMAGGAMVTRMEKNYFRTDLDAYDGNSGGPVFNEKTGRVEGVLVAGASDFVYDRKGDCYRSNVCKDNECAGELVMSIGLAFPHLP